MILPFSTKLNGKETFFVEKIQKALKKFYFPKIEFKVEYIPDNCNLIAYAIAKPKLHTIREDKNNRWKAGTLIDFYINVRTKNMFRFAPRIPVVSTQKVEITRHENCGFVKTQILIDDMVFYYKYGNRTIDRGILKLAQNDGFYTVEEFLAYFNQDFTGKIIHWTDLRY